MTTKYRMLALLLLLGVVFASGCIETTREGRHSGQITALENNGWVWPTWTVYVKSDISSSQEDVYCLENTALIPELQNYSETRQKITVLYRDELFVAPWRCGGYNGGIITGIEQR